MSEQPIIKVQDLYKTYRAGDVDVHALQGANLQVEKGEFVSVVGASGSGKSTLFNVLGALTSPTSGAVSIAGNNLESLWARSELPFAKKRWALSFRSTTCFQRSPPKIISASFNTSVDGE